MPMGKSAGRSARNRTADGVTERATPRQREGVDPPPSSFDWEHMRLEDEYSWFEKHRVQLTLRGRKVASFALWSLWVVACCMIALVFAAWFGVIS